MSTQRPQPFVHRGTNNRTSTRNKLQNTTCTNFISISLQLQTKINYPKSSEEIPCVKIRCGCKLFEADINALLLFILAKTGLH
jgi:hypothetical protein